PDPHRRLDRDRRLGTHSAQPQATRPDSQDRRLSAHSAQPQATRPHLLQPLTRPESEHRR
ncbi:MAG: hypothetical protein ACRDPO_09810, partial [Streptosporangiaceae bacterium]